jgi:hypothetical protein
MNKRTQLIAAGIIILYDAMMHIKERELKYLILFYDDSTASRDSFNIFIQILTSQLTYSPDLASLVHSGRNSSQIVKMKLAFVQ